MRLRIRIIVFRRRIQCVSTTCVNRLGLDRIALMQGAIEDTYLELDGVIRRKRILHRQLVVHRSADGLGVVVVAQAMKTGVESDRIKQDERVSRIGRHMRTQQRCLHKHTVHQLQVIHLHIIIMCVMGAERRQGIAVIKAQVAVAISISERDNALTAKRVYC